MKALILINQVFTSVSIGIFCAGKASLCAGIKTGAWAGWTRSIRSK